jgi:hypothetical protein
MRKIFQQPMLSKSFSRCVAAGDSFATFPPNTGVGLDVVWLGEGAATVVLGQDDGYDTIKNFQLGVTQFSVGSLSALRFADSAEGVQIFQNDELLAVVSWQSASTFSTNVSQIFVG